MAKIDVSLSPRSGPGPGPAPALLLFIVVGAQRVQMEEQEKKSGVVLHQEALGVGQHRARVWRRRFRTVHYNVVALIVGSISRQSGMVSPWCIPNLPRCLPALSMCRRPFHVHKMLLLLVLQDVSCRRRSRIELLSISANRQRDSQTGGQADGRTGRLRDRQRGRRPVRPKL